MRAERGAKTMKEIDILKAENAILRRALKWYADKNNWGWQGWNSLREGTAGDQGGKARRALERARKVK